MLVRGELMGAVPVLMLKSFQNSSRSCQIRVNVAFIRVHRSAPTAAGVEKLN